MTIGSILVVEDDLGIQKMLALYFEKRGYTVKTANDGQEAMEIINTEMLDIIILDIEMPLMDGYEVCERVRDRTDIPIIFISNNRQIEDKIKGLNLGADDYMTKPFNFDELYARVQSNIWRYELLNKATSSIKTKDGYFEFDFNSRECFINGKQVTLTEIEADILKLFVSEQNQVFSLEQIFDYVWGQNHTGDPMRVKVHIKNLRNKIEKDSTNPQYIKTMRGFGYKFNLLS